MPTPEEIRALLFALQDLPYREFTAKLIPNIDPATMIGIRAPVFQKAAKKIYRAGDYDAFLKDLPHRYFEETNLHAYLASMGKDFETVVRQLDAVLPFSQRKKGAVYALSAVDAKRPSVHDPLRH